MQPLLSVKNLNVQIPTRNGVASIVENLSFSIERGQALGLVGESGSGKSITAHAIMNLLPESARQTGEIEYRGAPLQRTAKIGMIFQDPMSCLNPSFTVEFQIDEVLAQSEKWSTRDSRKQRCRELLKLVGISDVDQRLRSFPHQLSGGISQRVMIAMALASEPELLIADEPTTALDVTIQAQILVLMDQLRRQSGMALLLITHDFGVVGQMVDRILVLYAGRMVEFGTKEELIRGPQHPYTMALLRSMPASQKATDFRRRLPVLDGLVPSLVQRPSGCQFHPRCAFQTQQCKELSPDLRSLKGREVACFFAGRLEVSK